MICSFFFFQKIKTSHLSSPEIRNKGYALHAVVIVRAEGESAAIQTFRRAKAPLACFWTGERNIRTQRKPTQVEGDLVQLHTNRNLS